jgi:hypothetical protein
MSAVVPLGIAGRPGRPCGYVALGDKVPVPAQQGCRLDEVASETLAEKELRQTGQDRSVGRL